MNMVKFPSGQLKLPSLELCSVASIVDGFKKILLRGTISTFLNGPMNLSFVTIAQHWQVTKSDGKLKSSENANQTFF